MKRIVRVGVILICLFLVNNIIGQNAKKQKRLTSGNPVTTNIAACISNGGVYNFNGVDLTTSGTYSDTLTTTQGSDSIVNLDLSVITPQSTSTTIEGCNSLVFKGVTYTSSAAVDDTIKSAGGCDSVYRTTYLDIKKVTPVTVNTSFSTCRSVVINGVTYTSSATVRDTVKTALGCDSLYRITNIKIEDIAPVIENIFLFDCKQVNYHGTVYTAPTIVRDSVRSQGGCDSVLRIINIKISGNPVTQTATLRGCKTVSFNGKTYTDSAVVKETIKNSMGCDSIYKVTNIIVRNIVPVKKTQVIKGCNSVVYNGVNYTSGATILDTLRTEEHCDSVYRTTVIDIQNLTPVSDTTTLIICKSVDFNGTTYTSSTTLTTTDKSSYGCDSAYHIKKIVVRNLVPVVKTTNLTGCNNVIFNGVNYTSSTSLTDTTKTPEGCDSLYNVTNITIKVTPVVQTNSLAFCSSIKIGGIWYTSSAVRTDTVRTKAGCDSIYKITNITIQNTQVNENNTVVGCKSVSFNGITYYNSTVVKDTLRTEQDCDSVYRTNNIIVKNITPANITNSLSDCKQVLFNGVLYTTSTVVMDTIRTAEGCDSIYRTNSINIYSVPPVTKEVTYRDCKNVTINSTTYTTSTTVTDTTKSVGGCDSVYNISHIVIITPTTEALSFTSCNKVTYKGTTYTSSTTFTDTVKSVLGCDSLYNNVTISINPITPVTQNSTLTGCNSVVYKGITYYSSQVISDTIKTASGCDSIYLAININILVTPTVKATNVTGCGNYVYNGISYSASTVLRTDTIRTAGGCDSIYLDLHINIENITPVNRENTLTGCGSVLFNGTTYTSSTVLHETIKSQGGCDSVYTTTNIMVQNIAAVTNTNTVKGCNSVSYNGTTYNASTVLRDTVRSMYGCDSIYNVTNIDVEKISAITKTTNVFGCNSYVYNGTTYTSSTVLRTDTLRTVGGCDSVYLDLNIKVENIVATSKTNTLKGCGSIIFNGVSYTNSTVVNDTLKSAGGCDSVYVTTNILVQNITPVTINNTLKGCNSLLFNGINYTSSATISDTTRSMYGCDSVYTVTQINIEKITAVTQTTTVHGCNSYVYNGTTYTSSTVLRTDTLRTIGGCDSVYLDLNINVESIIATSKTNTLTGCGSITFNGVNYTNSSVVNDILKSAGGCDSVYVTTNILVQNITPVTINNTLKGCNSLLFNGVNYTASAVINDTTRSMYGCDSIYTVTNIDIQNIAPVTQTTTVHGCNNYLYNGTTYTTSTLLTTDTLRTTRGCDSVYVKLNIEVEHITATNETYTLTGCGSIIFNNITYTSSTIVNDTLKSIGGCDSVYMTVNILVQNITPVTINDTLKGCNSIVFNGKTYTSSIIITDTTRSMYGCDSIYTVTNIDIQNITPVVETGTVSGCGSVVFNGITYIADTIVTDTARTLRGCDSVYIKTTIRVVTPKTETASLSGCGSAVLNNITYYESIIVTDTLRTQAGCDSLYTVTTITVQNLTPVKETVELFGCSSVVLHGITYTNSTVVMDTLHSTLGCDSAYITNNITIANLTPVTQTNTLFGCKSVEFNGRIYTSSTVINDTIRTARGCDSVYVVTNIKVDNFKLGVSVPTTTVYRGSSFSIQTSSATPYEVLAWQPANMFANQTALKQSGIADATCTVSVIAKSAAGCFDTTTVTMNVNNLNNFFVPNTFTPNNDGRNDVFKAYGNNVTKFDMKIFNQYGQMIFATNDINNGWNGEAKGQKQPVGVYVYVVKATMENGEVVEKKGSINLVR